MNFTSTLRCLLLVAVILAVSSSSNSQTANHHRGGSTWTVSELAWMSGDWQTDSSARAVSEEHWTRPGGGSMIGMSRTLVGDKTVSFEFLRLEQRGDAIFYVASPKGRCPATDFKLTRLSGQEAIFENPEHDFPKRIIYRKNSTGALQASIDAGEGTKSETFTFKPISK